jgi:magnesium transporter
MSGGAKITVTKTHALEWVLVERAETQETNTLRKKYRYAATDVKEILPPIQRPKIVARPDYLFMILLFPMFDRKTREINITEVDFFISKQRLVTVNIDRYQPLIDLFDACRGTNATRHICMSEDLAQLLYGLLNEMLQSVFPMLVHINSDLDALERRLFDAREKKLIHELLRIKTNIVNVRTAMQGHSRMIRKLIEIGHPYFPVRKINEYFDELVESSKEIWETLEMQKEIITALHETNKSLIEDRTNEIMKTLTMFSCIIFPLTLLATLWAMDVGGIPFRADALGFFKVLTILAICSGIMLLYFKQRRWF